MAVLVRNLLRIYTGDLNIMWVKHCVHPGLRNYVSFLRISLTFESGAEVSNIIIRII